MKKTTFFLLCFFMFSAVGISIFIVSAISSTSLDTRSSAKTTTSTKSDDNSKLKIVIGIGDSITLGHKDCITSTTIICALEPSPYLFKYAQSVYPGNWYIYNLAGSGTLASKDVQNIPYDNRFINNQFLFPETQRKSSENLLEKNGSSGLTRANLDEFTFPDADKQLIAYGRNDVNDKTVSLDTYKSAMKTIVSKSKAKDTILLTIPPMSKEGWTKYQPLNTRRREFDKYISDLNYPRELDIFFSSAIWEIAEENKVKVAPVAEYLYYSLTSDYFSTDNIHPSSQGHQLLSTIILSANTVKKLSLTNYSSKGVVVSAQDTGYGQVIYYKGTKFVTSKPLRFKAYANVNIPYVSNTTSAVVYSTVNVAPSAANRISTTTTKAR